MKGERGKEGSKKCSREKEECHFVERKILKLCNSSNCRITTSNATVNLKYSVNKGRLKTAELISIKSAGGTISLGPKRPL